MPPNRRRSAIPPALTDAEVAQLRRQVAAGERPRVVVRAASAAVPAGTRGSVVRVGDPAESEYVVVRLGKDEVPFAPGELALGGRRAEAAPAKRAPTKRTASTGRNRVPPMTVTLRFRDGAWTVEAQRGARRLGRAQPLRPGAVRAFAKHVDDPAVGAALIETVEACRSVVAAKADQLRAELAEAEAALRAYEAR